MTGSADSEYANTSHWLQTAPPWTAAAQPLPDRADVAVLGAGIMGCSLGYWLARAGLRPVVLERNAHPAGGATGRNGGLMVGGPGQLYQASIMSLGRPATREIMQATETNRQLLEEVLEREAISAEYTQPGFLTLAGHTAEAALVQASALGLQQDGYPAEWLELPAAEARLGTRLGSGFSGALYMPAEGAIHSARYAFGMAEAAARAGAHFAFEAAIERVEPAGRGWRIATARGPLHAEQVVCALNAWSGDLFPELAKLSVPTRGHVVLTEPAPFTLTPWSANHGFEYGRQLPDGRLLVGGKRESRPDLDSGYPPPPGENVPPVEPEVVAALRDYIPQIFPEAAGLALNGHWTGVMAFSPDSHPLAGPWPGRPGLWLLLGFTGHGMPYSQVLPAALAARIAGRDGPPVPRAFDPARFLGSG